MRFSLVMLAATAGFAAAAHADPVYSTSVSVGYDPDAPTSNFSNPTNVANVSGYTVKTGTDATNLYVEVVATNPSAVSGVNFANIYLGGSNFGGIVIGVTGSQAYITGGNGTAYDLTGTGYSFTATLGDIAFTLPFSFLETDPLNMGFIKQSPGNFMRVSYSQSFGYTFTGGTPLYGNNRLGGFYVPAALADVPEPISLALLAFGVTGAVYLRRRQQA